MRSILFVLIIMSDIHFSSCIWIILRLKRALEGRSILTLSPFSLHNHGIF